MVRTLRLSILRVVSYLNSPDEDGGFWLPHIPRSFVGSQEQICRLFDSILRQYPIGTFLIWKTTAAVPRRKFIDHFREAHRDRLEDFRMPEFKRKTCLVLDGQQRLQSLCIGLRGSYEHRELYLDILSGDAAAPGEMKFKFRFLDPRTATFPHVRVKDLALSGDTPRVIVNSIVEKAGRTLATTEIDRIRDLVALVSDAFRNESGIGYQEVDSIDHPTRYTDEDIAEIITRANADGTRLGRADMGCIPPVCELALKCDRDLDPTGVED